MTIRFPIVRNVVDFSTARSLTIIAVCALLILDGMSSVALATGLGVRERPAVFLSVSNLSLLNAARIARTRGFLTPLPSPQQPVCGISLTDGVRFLEQSTFGPSFATDPRDPNYPVSVTHVTKDVCFEGWLREQFNAPVRYPDNSTAPNLGTNYGSPANPGSCDDGAGAGGLCWSPQTAATTCTNNGNSNCNRDNYSAYVLQQQFFGNALTGTDQLRQRVAWALTEIDVASQLVMPASWMAPYVQLFDRDVFGNYRQLLYDLTLNPAMGQYLNMRGNTKTNVNENYAREVLQLFSLGVNELNDDGTLQLDKNSNPIPTYDQSVIANFAHVFTGWDLHTQLAPGVPNYRDPMAANENNHDRNPKTLLDGQTLPGGQDAATELNEALDNIFNHHNLGPFIGKQLIQKLVTSNPSPAYVLAVTNAFNSGRYASPGGTIFGIGKRGDMQAMIAAILLNPEARVAPTALSYGHLREPVLFITNTLRALGISNFPGWGYTTDFVLGDSFLPTGTSNVTMSQDLFRPASVFSYYPPDNQLPDSTWLAPEFGIYSTSTSFAHINFVYDIAYHKMPIDTRSRPLGTWINTLPFEPEAANDAAALVDDLNLRLMHGSLTPAVYGIVLSAVRGIPEANRTDRVREAIYLIASSSEYLVER